MPLKWWQRGWYDWCKRLRAAKRKDKRYRQPEVISGYQYGYPTGPVFETDVTLQWIFDEVSGNIVDEVSGVSLGPGAAVPVYGVDAGAPWANLSPGIRTTGGGFAKTNPITEANIGTSSFVWEWVHKIESNAGVRLVYSSDSTNARGWQLFWLSGNDTYFRMYVKTNEGTTYNAGWNNITNTNDGEYHKFRISADRDVTGEFTLYIDTDSDEGSIDLSSMNGENIDTGLISSTSIGGAASTTSLPFRGVFLELRQTKGNFTNDSGGGN